MKIIVANGKAEYAFLTAVEQRNRRTDKSVTSAVDEIIENVRRDGDLALFEYTKKFDKCKLKKLEVDREQIEKAFENADPAFVRALENAKENIMRFHLEQKQQGFENRLENDAYVGQRVRALKKVGLYVPGGTAAYPSSVLMNAIPAKIAGVEQIIMVTPPDQNGSANPDILAAAAICGVDRVFLVGGAQAVAALAFGTESIPKVDKIVGPGNIYVATAKKQLFGIVDIDMIAGPSEILIAADKTANAAFVAADLMSQAEHDPLAACILLTTDSGLPAKVEAEIERQIKTLSREDIIRKSLTEQGAMIVCRDLESMLVLADKFAPEHLELCVENPEKALEKIENAGSVFLGNYSPEPLGDYYAGPNHVLPTSGTARFFSPLSVDDFVKRISYIRYTKAALDAAAKDILTIADKEGLTAHANSIKERL